MLEHMVQLNSYNYVLRKSYQTTTTSSIRIPSINFATKEPLVIMSSPEKPESLASNHPTAVKAGGMRIVQDKSHLKKKETPVPKPEEEALKVSTSPPKQIDLMSGSTTTIKDGFPPAAVQAFHDKPAPTRDIQNSHKPAVHLQQPRKQ